MQWYLGEQYGVGLYEQIVVRVNSYNGSVGCGAGFVN